MGSSMTPSVTGVSGTTRLLAVLGDPMEHSLSPAMHNAAIRALGLDLVYVAHRIAPKDLKKAIDGFRRAGYLGVNLTVPHKEAGYRLSTALSPEARLSGSVNTLVFGPNGITGHTTDGAGLLRHLESGFGLKAKDKRILIIGAGGTARSVAAAAGGAASIHIANRTVAKAETLAALLGSRSRGIVTASSLDPLELSHPVSEADLIVNTTSTGLTGAAIPRFPWKRVKKSCIVVDVMYGKETPFLRDAKKHRLKHTDGLGMLVHQGALAFELWTGKKPPVREMLRAAEAQLKGRR